MSMKFRAHDTFFIRKGWLSKGMRNIVQKPNVFTDKNENPMDVLGIGANMVKSLRYWLQAVGLTTEPQSGKKDQTLTDFGRLVYDHDRYPEEFGPICLLHYKLVSDEGMAPAWYFFFNDFPMREFGRDDFLSLIQNNLKMRGTNVALRSLSDDFTCIINSYVPKYKAEPGKVSPESNIICPLSELGLIDIVSKSHGNILYKKVMPAIRGFSPWIIRAVIADRWSGQDEITLTSLFTDERGLGKTFNFDSISMLSLLHKTEQIGELKIIRTAGLDVIRVNRRRTFNECVEHYYAELEGEDS